MHLDRFVFALERAAPRGVRVGGRVIADGDEHALLPEERLATRTHRVDGLRASGAARVVARALLGEIGCRSVALPCASNGAPTWPPRVVGSLAHDDRVALAAIASSSDYRALGVDVEPATPLPHDLMTIVATPKERAWLRDDRMRARLLFCAKEAIFKAIHPLDGVVLDHHDIELDASLRARVRGGRRVRVVAVQGERVAALAFVRRGCRLS